VPIATDSGGTTSLLTDGYGLVATYAYNDWVSANFTVNNLFPKQYVQFLNIEPTRSSLSKAGS
jgi:hemoglobin/transferrin/lactoferrin receptor protein